MNDLLLILTGLFVFTSIGYLPSRLLPENQIRGRILAAPVLGFGIFGVVTTILYRFGVTPFNSLVILSALAVSAIVYWVLKYNKIAIKINKNIVFFGLITLFTIGITILPKWLGGAQFYAFQGNQWDHFNYISTAYSYQHYSYEALQLVNGNNTKNPAVLAGLSNLSARPTVGIVLAAFSRLFHATNALASYSYMVLMQINMLFASTFIIINIFNLQLILASLISLGLTIGFFQQYIFDINAWSQLACMPIAFLTLGFIVILFDPSRFQDLERFNWHNKIIIRFIFLIALGTASVFFYYPEIIGIYGIASSTAIGMSFLVSPNKHSVKIRFIYFFIAIALAILIATLYWQGTLGFFLSQVKQGSSHKLETNIWALYYQGYLLGREFFVLGREFDPPQNFFYRLCSFPIDFLMSIISLYYILPSGNWNIVLRCLWRVILYIFFALILLGSYQSIVSIWKAEKATIKSIFFAAAISTLSLPIALVGDKNFWVAGKALSMASPFLYFILIAPLLNNFSYIKLKKLSLLVTTIYLGGHLLFGLIRPVAATHAFGIHYPPPYPSIQKTMQKTMLFWNFESIIPHLKQCHQINLDIKAPLLERYTEIFLSDLDISWTSVNPIKLN